MISLYNADTGALVGQISEDELQFLKDQLEEEYLEDADYAFTQMTIDYLKGFGADTNLVALLQKALGSQDEIVLQWSRSQ